MKNNTDFKKLKPNMLVKIKTWEEMVRQYGCASEWNDNLLIDFGGRCKSPFGINDMWICGEVLQIKSIDLNELSFITIENNDYPLYCIKEILPNLCLNCLHCKIRIGTKEGEKGKNKYYSGYYCFKQKLTMGKKPYALTVRSTKKINRKCNHYDPMENDLNWIKEMRKYLPAFAECHNSRKDVIFMNKKLIEFKELGCLQKK